MFPVTKGTAWWTHGTAAALHPVAYGGAQPCAHRRQRGSPSFSTLADRVLLRCGCQATKTMSADRVLTQTASQTTNLQQKIRAKRKTKRTLSCCVSGYRGDQDRKRPHVHKNAQRPFFFFLRSQQEQPILLLSRNICYITPFRLLLHQLSVLEML